MFYSVSLAQFRFSEANLTKNRTNLKWLVRDFSSQVGKVAYSLLVVVLHSYIYLWSKTGLSSGTVVVWVLFVDLEENY